MSDAAQPPRKRSRQPHLEDDAELGRYDDSAFVEHPSLYYDDGNVNLSCENTLFRVHRSIVSKHSPVLCDILTSNEHEDRKPDILRGCLDVPLDETKEDAEVLLKIVYNDFRVESLKFAASELSLLSSAFRMATKYRIEPTLTEIYTRIQDRWPSVLDQHYKRSTIEKTLGVRRPLIFVRRPPGDSLRAATSTVAKGRNDVPQATTSMHPAHIIALLREAGCNDSSLLTPLFYASTCMSTRVGEHGRALEVLPPTDFARYVRGQERIRSYHTRVAVLVPVADTLGLPDGHVNQCFPAIKSFWATLADVGVYSNTGEIFATERDPVEAWAAVRLRLVAAPRPQICGECNQRLISRADSIGQVLWSNLPAFFELG
ncbi:uncharacterized protein C8Q71DRAFT_812365 [Rhodofomes roseus]|uniref:BTB domain-containing protein n=1 Tax=Rhodofomes roseus TaxID=34475 RepID=A0ABQ8KB75_9APHY|nr:uncharacterized protein C8Q71DRAFT_812365 [Rhodofomes roseus]KAH9834816.1 hypothetical protein C8Q71DRAFT_812365 [Rhodofomes roseus]